MIQLPLKIITSTRTDLLAEEKNKEAESAKVSICGTSTSKYVHAGTETSKRHDRRSSGQTRTSLTLTCQVCQVTRSSSAFKGFLF